MKASILDLQVPSSLSDASKNFYRNGKEPTDDALAELLTWSSSGACDTVKNGFTATGRAKAKTKILKKLFSYESLPAFITQIVTRQQFQTNKLDTIPGLKEAVDTATKVNKLKEEAIRLVWQAQVDRYPDQAALKKETGIDTAKPTLTELKKLNCFIKRQTNQADLLDIMRKVEHKSRVNDPDINLLVQHIIHEYTSPFTKKHLKNDLYRLKRTLDGKPAAGSGRRVVSGSPQSVPPAPNPGSTAPGSTAPGSIAPKPGKTAPKPGSTNLPKTPCIQYTEPPSSEAITLPFNVLWSHENSSFVDVVLMCLLSEEYEVVTTEFFNKTFTKFNEPSSESVNLQMTSFMKTILSDETLSKAWASAFNDIADAQGSDRKRMVELLTQFQNANLFNLLQGKELADLIGAVQQNITDSESNKESERKFREEVQINLAYISSVIKKQDPENINADLLRIKLCENQYTKHFGDGSYQPATEFFSSMCRLFETSGAIAQVMFSKKDPVTINSMVASDVVRLLVLLPENDNTPFTPTSQYTIGSKQLNLTGIVEYVSGTYVAYFMHSGVWYHYDNRNATPVVTLIGSYALLWAKKDIHTNSVMYFYFAGSPSKGTLPARPVIHAKPAKPAIIIPTSTTGSFPFGVLENTAQSCYLDSLLMCLFIANHPFVSTHILTKDVTKINNGLNCAEPRATAESTMKVEISELLMMPYRIDEITNLLSSSDITKKRNNATTLARIMGGPRAHKLYEFHKNNSSVLPKATLMGQEKEMTDDELKKTASVDILPYLLLQRAWRKWTGKNSKLEEEYKQFINELKDAKIDLVLRDSISTKVTELVEEIKKKAATDNKDFENKTRHDIQKELVAINTKIHTTKQKIGPEALREALGKCSFTRKYSQALRNPETADEAIMDILNLFDVVTPIIPPIIRFNPNNISGDEKNVIPLNSDEPIPDQLINFGQKVYNDFFDSEMLIFARLDNSDHAREADPLEVKWPANFTYGSRTLHLRGMVVYGSLGRHYVCYIKHKEVWYFCNDLGPQVRAIGTLEELNIYAAGHDTEEGYNPWRRGTLFFYFTS